MTEARDKAKEALGASLRTLKRGAIQAGHQGLNATARMASLAESKIPTQEQAATAVDQLSRRARKKQARAGERAAYMEELVRKETRRASKKARKASAELAHKANRKVTAIQGKIAKLEKKAAKAERGKSRRRWPWMLGIGAVAATAVYIMRARQNSQNDTELEFATEEDYSPTINNGTAPHGRKKPASAKTDHK